MTFASQAKLHLSWIVLLFGQFFGQMLPFYLFGIQVYVYNSQSWQSTSFKKNERERESLEWVCPGVLPWGSEEVFQLSWMLQHCWRCHTAKSDTDMLPGKSSTSLALPYICIRSTGSLFLPCGSRGVTLLPNQQLPLLQHPQIALLSKTVIICFLSDELINETGFGQYENKVVVLDCQMELPQGA